MRFGPDRAAHEAAIDAALRDAGAEVVCLAGYMRLMTPFLVDGWRGRMLNVHPSLLPVFPRLYTHERALTARVKLHGCTVHLVTQTMDEDPILARAAVPVLPDDFAESLAARVLVQEYVIYPLALRAFAAGRAVVAAPADAALRNPLAGGRRPATERRQSRFSEFGAPHGRPWHDHALHRSHHAGGAV
jgi:phosphoribosylglycinamide formyltransferase-1